MRQRHIPAILVLCAGQELPTFFFKWRGKFNQIPEVLLNSSVIPNTLGTEMSSNMNTYSTLVRAAVYAFLGIMVALLARFMDYAESKIGKFGTVLLGGLWLGWKDNFQARHLTCFILASILD